MGWGTWLLENLDWIIPAVITAYFARYNVKFARTNVEFARTNVQITEKQKETVAAQLRLNLFEKRMAIYNIMMTVMSNVVLKRDSIDEEFMRFQVGTRDSVFLFGKDINDELEIIRDILSRLYAIYLDIQSGVDGSVYTENSVSLNQERGQLALKLHELLSKEPSLFKKYLDFSDCVITEEAQTARRL